MKFDELNINPEIVKSLKEMEITTPTEIQEKAIPLIQQGKDVIGMSKTGSGKTCAFGVPIVERIVQGNGIQALIMCPTRELAVQISEQMKKFGRYKKFTIATIFGGVAINPQIDRMEKSDIVVGTPGRLLDHLQRQTMDLSKVNMVVLDEADKMVEMGFIEDISKILQCTPKKKQMLLFGATISDEISMIKKKFMNNPEIAKAESHVKEEYLKQYYYNVEQHQKFSLLVHLLKKENAKRVIIFCSTRSTVELVAKNLRKQDLDVEMIHGKLNQNKRLQVIENFNKGSPEILVASAVAARGLDIKDVTHIFNYDLGQDTQEYIHRIGRTARAGESGKAITLLSQKDHDTFRNILRYNHVDVECLPDEQFPKLQFDARHTYNRDSIEQFGGRGRQPYGGRGRQSFGGRGRQSFGRRNGAGQGSRQSFGRSNSSNSSGYSGNRSGNSNSKPRYSGNRSGNSRSHKPRQFNRRT